MADSPSLLDAKPSLTPQLPLVSLANADAIGPLGLRSSVLKQKESLRKQRQSTSEEARQTQAGSPERQALYGSVQAMLQEEESLEELLRTQFLPQHGASQLISPRTLFVSPLFRVGSKAAPRQRFIELELRGSGPDAAHTIKYCGPELRQSDGLVFLALVNMARDFRAGVPVSFSVEGLCRALVGQYSGPVRARLKESIQRLQQGLLKFDKFSVQLCQRFDYPSSGDWTVALDRQVVELFATVPNVWLNLPRRLALPEGLATWLYAYIESQTTLIPVQTKALRELCGSEASDKPFENKLREALRHLVSHGVLEPDWRLEKGVLRWMKARVKPAQPAV